jgi:hypothetical protein
MVDTTAGLLPEIMEALAPHSHCRIPWKCPQYHMSTCSIYRRVTGSGHPLNRELEGYCRGNVPHVLWVADYSPKF